MTRYLVWSIVDAALLDPEQRELILAKGCLGFWPLGGAA